MNIAKAYFAELIKNIVKVEKIMQIMMIIKYKTKQI